MPKKPINPKFIAWPNNSDFFKSRIYTINFVTVSDSPTNRLITLGKRKLFIQILLQDWRCKQFVQFNLFLNICTSSVGGKTDRSFQTVVLLRMQSMWFFLSRNTSRSNSKLSEKKIDVNIKYRVITLTW